MNQEELKERFKRFALDIVQFAENLPDLPGYRNVRFQMIKNRKFNQNLQKESEGKYPV